jgi:hypothetical protein
VGWLARPGRAYSICITTRTGIPRTFTTTQTTWAGIRFQVGINRMDLTCSMTCMHRPSSFCLASHLLCYKFQQELKWHQAPMLLSPVQTGNLSRWLAIRLSSSRQMATATGITMAGGTMWLVRLHQDNKHAGQVQVFSCLQYVLQPNQESTRCKVVTCN